jgi:MFS family permease
MSSSTLAAADRAGGHYLKLVWLTLGLALAYLCVAMSLPVTPVFVSNRLGFGNALAGLAVGVTFASTILTRGVAGQVSDRRGGKYCMVRGLGIYLLAGLVCGGAGWPSLPPGAAYGVLIVGRLLLGWGESLVTVGLVTWALGIGGPGQAGRVFALIGMGLYGAFTVGSPVGVALFDGLGFTGVMAACTAVPLIGLAMVLPVAGVAPLGGERPPIWRILGQVCQPGMVVFFAGVGFAAIGAFMTLLFLRQGWPHAGLGLSCFGAAFVLVRLLGAHLPDRFGSIPVALVSMVVEAAGQYAMWRADGPGLALAGAMLSGAGCSLIYPAMGIEVVRRVQPHLRGTASGGFAAFQDLAFGLTGPLAGLLADRFGYSVVFLVGGVSASLGVALLMILTRNR